MSSLKAIAYSLLFVLGLLIGGAMITQRVNADNEAEIEKEVETEDGSKKVEVKIKKEGAGKKIDMRWFTDPFKKAFKKSAKVKFKVVKKDADNREEVRYLEHEVTDTTEKSYKVKVTKFTAEGKAEGDATVVERNWDQYFFDIDEFDDKTTVVKEEKIKISGGEVQAKVYSKTVSDNGKTVVKTYYFSKDEDGKLLKMTSEVKDGDKKESSSYELVEEFDD